MSNGNAVQLAVQLETADLQIGTEELVDICDSLNQSLAIIAKWNMNGLLTSLNVLAGKMDAVATACMPPQENNSFSFLNAMEALNSLLGIVDTLGENKEIVKLVESLSKTLSKTLTPVLTDACKWIGGLFSQLGLGKLSLIVIAIALVVAAVIDNFNLIKERFVAIWDEHIKPIWDRLVPFVENLKTAWDTVIMPIITWVYQVLEPGIMAALFSIIDVIEVIASFVELIVLGAIDSIDGVIQFTVGLFTGDFGKMIDGIIKIVRGAIETVMGLFSPVVAGVIWGINTVIGAVYALIASIVNTVEGALSAVGNWFGLDLGGWHMEPMKEPVIPYLAQGAVLPANKPFLAMVGDQRHGTNVEAPLATIQEAVALVMEDQFNGMMAGFEAVTARQEQILETLLGIEIGDTTIGQAAARYNRKMAIIKGGM